MLIIHLRLIKKLIKFLIIFIFLNSIKTIHSESSKYNINEFHINSSALSKANTTVEIDFAISAEFKRSEKIMNNILTDIKSNPKYKVNYKKIEEEQAIWIKYRNLHIGTIFPKYIEAKIIPWGTSQTYHEFYIKTEMNWDRVKVLYKWIVPNDDIGMYGGLDWFIF